MPQANPLPMNSLSHNLIATTVTVSTDRALKSRAWATVRAMQQQCRATERDVTNVLGIIERVKPWLLQGKSSLPPLLLDLPKHGETLRQTVGAMTYTAMEAEGVIKKDEDNPMPFALTQLCDEFTKMARRCDKTVEMCQVIWRKSQAGFEKYVQQYGNEDRGNEGDSHAS